MRDNETDRDRETERWGYTERKIKQKYWREKERERE